MGEAERGPASAAGDDPGGMEGAVAQPFAFGSGQFAIEVKDLGPSHEVFGARVGAPRLECPTPPDRYIAQVLEQRHLPLDALRGLAAIGVVLWHYQHFQTVIPHAPVFGTFLALPYGYGYLGVELFFALSGFVFYAKYFDAIANRATGLRKFVALRISRLYPLLLVTTITVAGLQFILLATTGVFWIYHDNTVQSFAVNLLFFQSAISPVGGSFNGPSWSISVEFWLYLGFFLVSVRFRDRHIVPAVIAAIAISARALHVSGQFAPFNQPFLEGLSMFFLGGLIVDAAERVARLGRWKRELIGAGAIVAALLGLALLHLNALHIIDWLTGEPALFFSLGVTPLLILGTVTSPTLARVGSNRVSKWLGEISYGVYMWHVPLQLAVIAVIVEVGVPLDPGSPLFFVGFLAGCLIVAGLGYRLLERPAQQFLRRVWVDSTGAPYPSSSEEGRCSARRITSVR
jgi:peptidoglycan/LPS O-acetylase OafA/YrhL